MNFVNAWALLYLLSLPVLVLLYFLKLKRPYVKAPSVLLWQKVIQDMRVNSPFQKLKRSLLLLLQILILLGLIFALSRPLLKSRDEARASLVVLLDRSASMMTENDDGKTRFALALDEIRALIDGLRHGEEMMLIAFDVRAKVICGFTGNKRRLRDLLKTQQPVETATNVREAFMLAASVANARSQPRVILISDGAFDDPPNIELPVDVEYRRVGEPADNIAVSGLDVRRSIDNRNKIEMFVSARNFADRDFSGNMYVYLDNKMLDSKYFSVGAGETLSQIFQAELPMGGGIRVKLDVKDALVCDNSAWKMVEPPQDRAVMLVGAQTWFIERALRSMSGLRCDICQPDDPRLEQAGTYLAVIWNNVDQAGVAPGHNVYLGCAPAIEGIELGDTLDAPAVADWDQSHPINRFLDYDNLVIAASRRLVLPEEARVLLRSTRTPLIGMYRTRQGMLCLVGFDIIKSNWPLLISFPLFFNNCLIYFEEQSDGKNEGNVRTGDTLVESDGHRDPRILRPDGKRVAMRKSLDGSFTYNEVDRCGIYEVTLNEEERYEVAANLFSTAESTLAPRDEVLISGKKIKHKEGEKDAVREYWKPLLAAALLFLLTEWAVYHRRWFV